MVEFHITQPFVPECLGISQAAPRIGSSNIPRMAHAYLLKPIHLGRGGKSFCGATGTDVLVTSAFRASSVSYVVIFYVISRLV